MYGPFSIQNEHLSILRVDESVDVFRKLLHAEAKQLGIPGSSINVPRVVNVPDGGIDASVDAPNDLPEEGSIIKRGQCRYQIKTGDAFKPWTMSSLKKELFKNKNPSRENLASGVLDCLEKNGLYVIVCFGIDIVDKNLRKAKKNISDLFAEYGFNDARYLIISQNNLRSVVERYPSVACDILGYQNDFFNSYKSWSEHADMQRELTSSDKQSSLISHIRDKFKKPESTHVRFFGEPGIGKTRVLLESFRDSQLYSLVVYTDRCEKFLDSNILMRIVRDEQIKVIVVLDDCDTNALQRFLNRTANAADRIRSISVSQENDKIGEIAQIQALPLSDDEIAEIIKKHYAAPDSNIRLWADLCSGSPRVAHVIGKNLTLNPDDLLKPPAMDNVWERYIRDNRGVSDQRNEITRRVLLHLALFKKFGYGVPFNKETEIIVEFIRKNHSIDKGTFHEVVKSLRERRVLQGDHTLYITPKALHIWLWTEWFDTYGANFDYNSMTNGLTNSLIKGFHEMFRYADESGAAKRCIDQLVGPNGPFRRDKEVIRTERGSRFLLFMTEASPESCLECLESTIGRWSKDDLQEFTTGRRNILFALEKIVMYRHLFQRGARLLLALAEAENETYYSNNATGIFVGLFSPATGKVSPTQAPPEERFPILKEAIESESRVRRQLGLQACSTALDTGMHGRMEGAEIRGLRRELEPWSPKTIDDYLQGYERVFGYLIDRVANMDESERNIVGEILLKRARGLLSTPSPLSDLCIKALNKFFAEGIIDKPSVWVVLDDVLEYDVDFLQDSIRESLESMQNEMIDTTFSGRLHRFVGRNRWKDHIDPNKDRYLDDLARQSIDDPSAFMSECAWLVTKEAWNGDVFGDRLGTADESNIFLDPIVAAQDAASETESSLAFLAGYVGALFRRDRKRWEALVDEWAMNESRKNWIPDIIWRCELDHQIAERVTSLIRENGISWRILGQLQYSMHFQNLPEEIIVDWFDILSSSTPELDAARLAVGFLYAYYIRGDNKRPILIDIGKRVLLNSLLMKPGEHKDDLLEYQWIEAGKAFVGRHPDQCSSILNFLIQDALGGGMFIGRYDKEGYQFARNLISCHPASCWNTIEGELNRGDQSYAYKVIGWIAGGYFNEGDRGVWSVIPTQLLWQWVDQDVDVRAALVADFAPNKIEREGANSVTYELILRYGDRDDVSRALMSRFSSGLWRGNASDHYRNEQEKFRLLHSKHEEPKIREWIDKMIGHLDDWIEHSKILEERWD